MSEKVGTTVAVICVVGLLVVGGGGLRYVVQEVRAQRFLADAHEAVDAEQHDEAARLFAKSLEISDDDAHTWSQYGWALAGANRHDAAVEAFERALALEPKNVHATCNRAYSLKTLGRLEEALGGFEASAALDFHVPQVDGESASILIDLDRLDEADETLDRALARREADADTWNWIGNILVKRDRQDDAITAYERALADAPRHAHACFNRGLAFVATGRDREAIVDFDASIERGHRTDEAYVERAKARNRLGDVEGGLADLETARESGDEAVRAWVATGDVHAEEGDDDDALDAYRAAIEIDPGHAGALREIGEILRRRGELDEALASFDLSIESDDRSADTFIERGRLHLDDLVDVDAATADFDRAVELDPDYVHARTNRGWLRESQEDWEGALEDYAAALALSPDDVWTIGSTGRALGELGRPEEAFALFERAIVDDPAGAGTLVEEWRKVSEAARSEGDEEPDLRLVQGELTALRGRAFTTNVPSETQAPAQFGERVRAGIEGSSSAEQRRGRDLGLRRLGLLRTPAEGKEDIDLADAVVHALETQAAAYYDPELDTFFYVAEGMPGDMLETVAAHELVHALQDQHEDLSEFLSKATRRGPGAPRNDDRVFAYRAVAEGEATFVQFAWQSMRTNWLAPDDALRANAMVVGFVSGMDTRKLLELSAQMMSKLPDDNPVKKSLAQAESIPPYVLEPFLGAYFKGAGLCNYQYSKFGWAGIDALYARPPESAEQVLHPVRYEKKRDRPTSISLPDLGNAEAAGWARCDAAVHGELYLTLLLTENDAAPRQARRATAGWDGDVYAAYRNGDRVAIVLLTTWDTEKDAADFADAYRTMLLRRAGSQDDGVLTVEPLGDDVVSLIPSGTPDDSGAVLARGRDVLIADGWPEDLLLPVVERLVAQPIDHVD